MSIVSNVGCPKCIENGFDHTKNHLLIFSDGGKFCGKKDKHKDGLVYYVKPDGTDPITDTEIDGSINYTPEQFLKLQSDGRLLNDYIRQLALSGMSAKNRYEAVDDDERAIIDEAYRLDVEWFEQLRTMNLVDRGIHGLIAKMYNVRVGHDADGKINRHYYPVHDRKTLETIGAKARTLPKDFRTGHLGRRFGDTALFGMHTTQQVMDSGTFRKGKMGKLVVVGGECDAQAAQQMIVKSLNKLDSFAGIKNLDGLKLAHVWSPTKGETCLEEIVANREYIDQFEEVVWAFDNDDVGNKLNLECARLFRQKSKFFMYPQGCKDANQCLKEGRDRDFMDAWWNPQEARVKGKLKAASAYSARAKEMAVMGLPYFIEAMNPITFGVRLRYLSVWGAGTGVGKTEITTKHITSLINQGKPVVAIYLENSPDEVLKKVAGSIANKDFESPPLFAGESYDASRDYTEEDLSLAIDNLTDTGLLIIPELQGSKDVSVIMEVLMDSIAVGYQYFVIDNLTAFEHHIDGKVQTGVQAMDETMKRIGTFKDENDVNIMLLSHLTRPDKSRTPHELGGEVYITDLRGTGSISFWANAIWGIERNTQADTIQDKCTTLIRNLKSRGVGYRVGSTVVIRKDLATGDFHYLAGVSSLPQVGRDKQEPDKQPVRQVAANLINDAMTEQEF